MRAAFTDTAARAAGFGPHAWVKNGNFRIAPSRSFFHDAAALVKRRPSLYQVGTSGSTGEKMSLPDTRPADRLLKQSRSIKKGEVLECLECPDCEDPDDKDSDPGKIRISWNES